MTDFIIKVISLYNNVKGFSFVAKHIVTILIGGSAFVTAIIFLTGVKFSIGA